MAYGVIMCCHLHMPLYILGTFTEYPELLLNLYLRESALIRVSTKKRIILFLLLIFHSQGLLLI